MDVLNSFVQYLEPVPGDLFISRNDPNDIRFGDIVLRDIKDYVDAEVALVGCPDDSGVKRNKGRPGACSAPLEIRKELFRFPLSDQHDKISLIDIGNIKIEDHLEDTHENLYNVVKKLVFDGKKVVVLGGGNDISYPDCSALAALRQELIVFNIDRHLDIRIDSQRSSGTPYRQLLDDNIIDPALFYEIGTNSFCNSKTYIRHIEEIGAHILYLGDIRNSGVGTTINDILKQNSADHIFWGFDIDVVRSSEAPGVSDPGPMGFTAREICEVADAAASDPRTRIIEITEVNPKFDIDNMTSKLAANVIYRALAAIGNSQA